MLDLNLSIKATTIVRVTASSLNVRTGPSTSYAVVKSIPYNSKWYVLETSNGWYKIANKQWISSAYTALSSPVKTVQITASSLNVRTAPSTSYPVVRSLPLNSIVDVLETTSNNWYKINNYEYISAYYTKDAKEPTLKNAIVTASSLNVRTGSSTSYTVVRSLPKNSIINIYEESNNWYNVGYNQWVSKTYTSPTTVNCSSYNNNLTSWFFIYKGQDVIPEANTEINKLNGYYVFNTNKKVIYLTFDSGYEAGYTNSILNTLKSKNVKVVFFVSGSYIDSNPNIVKRMVNEGHIVANHTVTHPDLPYLATNPSAFKAEILGVENKYKAVTGLEMIKMLRPPSGYYSMRSLCLTQQLSYSSVFWSFGYRDWDTNDQPSPSYAFEKITTSTHPGAIFLLHAVSSTNASILGNVIDTIRGQGYTFEQLHL